MEISLDPFQSEYFSQFVFIFAGHKPCIWSCWSNMETTKKEENSKPKSSKLKPFQMIQKNLITSGISPKLMHQAYPLNWKILTNLLLLTAGITSLCVYVLNNDETFSEYTQSIYVGIAGIFFILGLVALVINVEKLFSFINDCGALLNTCEWRIPINLGSFPNFANFHHLLNSISSNSIFR